MTGSIPRSKIRPGARVRIVLKKDQGTSKRTEGIVAAVLTRSATHPHGIKVRLTDGKVGRVQELLPGEADPYLPGEERGRDGEVEA